MVQGTKSDLDIRLDRKPPVRLVVEDLRVAYQTERGPFRAVDGISFEVAPGSVLGLVGESGCGKSTVVKALLRLLPETAKTSGRVLLDDADILTMDAKALRSARWNKIALVTQSAMNALDPVIRIG
ncbi:MAG: ATP-binding cassette domain-containing protein, partial [Hyphomicrobiales bacterium]|nr:ATP-binding cassette domain-containing protein [Hyphomicrobiales bacterium]